MFDAAPAAPASPPPLRAVAFYLPQFHPTAENDAFWGPGFSEWHNVVQARPRFAGHSQPHLPADLGFYDLRLAETRAAQAALARKAGLSGFCWYHYWFGGRRVLNRPFDAVLSDPDYDFPFMLAWANENWTRAWDGGPREVLIDQVYSDADTRAHARHLIPALSDPRAIRLGGRPAFAVYAADHLPDPARWCDLFRQTLLDEGIEVHLMRVERWLDRDRRPPGALGFDSAVEFQPFSRSFHAWLNRPRTLGERISGRLERTARALRPRDRHHDLTAFVQADAVRPLPDYPLHPGVCPSWDNSARRPKGEAIIFRGASPALFHDWTAVKALQARAAPDERLLFVNAWNEWAEGNHMEPCQTYSHAWINAFARGLRAVDVAPVEA